MANEPKREKGMMTMVGEYASLAMILPACAVVGYAMGYGLDRLFGTAFLKLVLLLLGIVGGLIQIIRQLSADSRG